MLTGAYYYAWYSGKWLQQTVRKNDLPILGEYDNTVYSETLIKEFQMLKDAGIDFISLSWNGLDYNYILDAAKKADLKVTYFFESMRHHTHGIIPPSAHSLILKEFEMIAEDMEDPCWLKIDNRPVIMIYVTRAYKDSSIFREIRKLISNVFLVGDEYFWDKVPDEKIEHFDALTAYNMFQMGRFKTEGDEEIANSYLQACKQQMDLHAAQCTRLKKPLWGNAMPGYNDLGVRPDRLHCPIPRLNGEYFKQSLADALEVSVGNQALMITSANEWYEDTQILPCKSYENLYLDILKGLK